MIMQMLLDDLHNKLASMEVINCDMVTRICFIVSVIEVMIAYLFLQLKSSHVLIGGIFEITMMI